MRDLLQELQHDLPTENSQSHPQGETTLPKSLPLEVLTRGAHDVLPYEQWTKKAAHVSYILLIIESKVVLEELDLKFYSFSGVNSAGKALQTSPTTRVTAILTPKTNPTIVTAVEKVSFEKMCLVLILKLCAVK